MIDLDIFKTATDEEFMEMTDALTENEQAVLLLLRGVGGLAPMSSEEAGRELGMTGEEVRDAERRALQTVERLNSGWRKGSIIIFHGDGTQEEF